MAVDGGVGPVPLAVVSGDGEAFQSGSFGFRGGQAAGFGGGDEALIGVVEVDAGGLAFDGELAEEGAADGKVCFPVVSGEGPEGEAFADIGLIGWVDVFGVTDVDGAGHACVGDLEALALDVADGAPFPAGWIRIGFLPCGELDEVEGHFRVLEPRAPCGDHGGFLFEVEAGVGIVFALVPEDAVEAHGNERGDVAVVEGGAAWAVGFFAEGEFREGRRQRDGGGGRLGGAGLIDPRLHGGEGGGEFTLVLGERVAHDARVGFE